MRVKGGIKARQYRRQKKKTTKVRGTRNKSYLVSNQTIIKAGQYAYDDRKV